MKKHFIQLFSAAALVLSLASCSSDDPKLPGEDLKQKSYSDEEVAVNINGSNASNQVVTFTPIAGEESKANITIASKPIDISGMMGRAANQPVAGIPAAGIIPGSPEVTFPVDLVGDADNCTFTGSADSEYCTFNYSGAVTDSKLSLDLTDVKLKNTSLVGTYKMGEEIINYSDVMRIEWESEKGVILFSPEYPTPIKSVVGLAMQFTNVNIGESDTKVNLYNALATILKEVSFNEDGSITAKYADTKQSTLPIVEAPKGLAQYVVTEEGKMRVFLNINNIIAESKKAESKARAEEETPAEPSLDITTILSKIDVESLMTLAIPMVSQGIPVNYGQGIMVDTSGDPIDDPDPKFMAFYIDQDILLPILKIVKPLFTDKEFCDTIVALASKDPDMGMMAGMLGGILGALPDVIDTTSMIELGINLHKQ